MRSGYNHVQRMHWTFSLSHGYGRKMTRVLPSNGVVGKVERCVLGERSSALRAGRIFDTPSLGGYTLVDFCLRSSTRRL